MSDNVRTRIAAAIYMQEYPKRCESCPVPHPSPWAYEMADAVIRELGLWQQLSNWHPGYYRYVTDWKADNE